MKTQPQHTQGEWKLDGIYIDATDDSVIAQILSEDSKENQANGERIVKAVNMHDSLIHFLEQLIDCRNSLSYYSDKSLLDSRIVQAKELLKQAEQK